MRDRASRHRDQLTELIHQAELARRDLLDDPAALRRQQVRRPTKPSGWPGVSARPWTPSGRCREHAWSARDQHAKLIAAGATLDHHETKDVDGELTRITESAGELTALEAETARAKQDFEKLRDDAEAQLAAAAQEGLTPQSLASAATLLDGVPGRLEELAAGQCATGRGRRGHRRAGPAAGNRQERGSATCRPSPVSWTEARVTANADT